MSDKINKYGMLVIPATPSRRTGRIGETYKITGSTVFPTRRDVLGWDVKIDPIGTYGVITIGSSFPSVDLGWDQRGQTFSRFFPASLGNLEILCEGMRDESWGPITVRVVGR